MKRNTVFSVALSVLLLAVLSLAGCNSENKSKAEGHRLVKQYVAFLNASADTVKHYRNNADIVAAVKRMASYDTNRELIESMRKSDYKPTQDECREMATAIVDLSLTIEDQLFAGYSNDAPADITDSDKKAREELRQRKIDEYADRLSRFGSLRELSGK